MSKHILPTFVVLAAFVSVTLAQSATETERRAPAAGVQAADRPAAQATQPAGARTAATTPSGARQALPAANLDQQIAACLVLGNEEEIALAQFAQQRAQSEPVKKFAQMMIEQHQQAVTKIQQAAPEIARWNLKLADKAARATSEVGRRPDGAAQPGPQFAASTSGAEQPMLALTRRAHEECLSLAQQELGQKQGAEFDQAYMGQQYFAHVGMLAKIRASQEFASEQLRPLLQESEKVTQNHLAQAKQIKEQLKSENGRRQTTLKPETPAAPPTTEATPRP